MKKKVIFIEKSLKMLLIIDIRKRRKNNIKSNEQYNKQMSDKERKKGTFLQFVPKRRLI